MSEITAEMFEAGKRFRNADEVKRAVAEGCEVYWYSPNYRVVRNEDGEFFVTLVRGTSLNMDPMGDGAYDKAEEFSAPYQPDGVAWIWIDQGINSDTVESEVLDEASEEWQEAFWALELENEYSDPEFWNSPSIPKWNHQWVFVTEESNELSGYHKLEYFDTLSEAASEAAGVLQTKPPGR